MKKLIGIVAMAMLTLSVAAHPQNDRQRKEREKQTPEQMAEKQTERQTAALSLTDKQEKEVYKLNLENAKKREVKAEARKKEHDKFREEAIKEREKYDADMKKILTQQQYTTWKDKKEANAGRRADMRKQNGPHKGQGNHEKKQCECSNCSDKGNK